MGQSDADRAAKAQGTTLLPTPGLSGRKPPGEAVGSVVIEKLAYSVGEAAASAGISRSWHSRNSWRRARILPRRCSSWASWTCA